MLPEWFAGGRYSVRRRGVKRCESYSWLADLKLRSAASTISDVATGVFGLSPRRRRARRAGSPNPGITVRGHRGSGANDEAVMGDPRAPGHRASSLCVCQDDAGRRRRPANADEVEGCPPTRRPEAIERTTAPRSHSSNRRASSRAWCTTRVPPRVHQRLEARKRHGRYPRDAGGPLKIHRFSHEIHGPCGCPACIRSRSRLNGHVSSRR